MTSHPHQRLGTPTRWGQEADGHLFKTFCLVFHYRKMDSTLSFLHQFTADNDTEMKSLLASAKSASEFTQQRAGFIGCWPEARMALCDALWPPSLPPFLCPSRLWCWRGGGVWGATGIKPPSICFTLKGTMCGMWGIPLIPESSRCGSGGVGGCHVLGTAELPETGHRATTLLWESGQNENTRGGGKVGPSSPPQQEKPRPHIHTTLPMELAPPPRQWWPWLAQEFISDTLLNLHLFPALFARD